MKKRDMDPRNVLDKLKEKFSVHLIHDSLVDLIEHKYSDKLTRRLVASVLELLHDEEGLHPCHDYHCEHEREELHKS